MRQMSVKWYTCSLFFIVMLTGCAGKKMIVETHLDKSSLDQPVSNVMTLGLSYKNKENTQLYFEESIVKQLKAIGVEAVSTGHAVSIPSDRMMKKNYMMSVINKYNCDAVLISFMAGKDDKEIPTMETFKNTDYYNCYSQLIKHAHSAAYSVPRTLYRFDTYLYDAKTGKLIWSGTSEAVDPDSGNQCINETVHLIIGELQKNNIIRTR